MLVRRLAAVPATPYNMANVNVFLLEVRARDPTQSSDLSCPRTSPEDDDLTDSGERVRVDIRTASSARTSLLRVCRCYARCGTASRLAAY